MGRKRLSSCDSATSRSNSPTKLNSNGGGIQQRNAANARERARMRVLSKAFIKLKTHLPWVPHDTKLSKLDTLRLATSYILHLTQILDTDDLSTQTNTTAPPTTMTTTTPTTNSNSNVSLSAPNNFSWPYSSCHRSSSLCSINSRLTSTTNLNHHDYSTHQFSSFPNRNDFLSDHQENLLEEKHRI